ncbi:NADP oxidoreductase [Paenibacillus sp. HJL G12]|uniref:NADP oxidoreductase n=1 Tax=Paenibacillus dendrobii TaxID=2691084 RepID=A0A7X3IDY2_9BACL|nr:NADPH-dependent F420 reductase [Paenibacillus dendrobii]MWV42144.1 NADP oxidoreductase [Paenibacillus dendrobii]
MKIAIIGAGNIGGNLARRLTKLGHDVSIANSRGPQTLQELAAETGAKPKEVTDVARNAELVIVTIPQKNIPDLPAGVLDHTAPNAVIIDTGNYYPQQRDGLIAEIEAGLPESRWVEQHLNRTIIKAFNGIAAQSLLERGLPSGSPGRLALPVAGDDPSAKQIVLALIEELGFDALDAGGLEESWRQQPGTPSYREHNLESLRQALSEASPERSEAFKA